MSDAAKRLHSAGCVIARLHSLIDQRRSKIDRQTLQQSIPESLAFAVSE